MVRLALIAWVLFGSGFAQAQIASPSPLTGRSSSSPPLSEAFTPNSIFPPAPAKPPVTVQKDPDDEGDLAKKPDGGLLPIRLPQNWSGGADVGINGASGNSESFNFRGGWNVRRKTEDNALTSDFLYVYSVQNAKTNTPEASAPHKMAPMNRAAQRTRRSL